MKTKNVRVRERDIKQGVTIYIACPACGITKHVISGRPYQLGNIGLFVKSVWHFDGSTVNDYEFSLCDAGINSGDSYNDQKSFFKLKHAKEWVDKWSKDKGFIKRHKAHERMCRRMDNFIF